MLIGANLGVIYLNSHVIDHLYKVQLICQLFKKESTSLLKNLNQYYFFLNRKFLCISKCLTQGIDVNFSISCIVEDL
jgi:hypothetical protein